MTEVAAKPTPVFFLQLMGGGPYDGVVMIVTKEKVTSMARENAARAKADSKADVEEEFLALREFAERTEVGAVYMASKMLCFCMSGADAIYRLGKDIDPKYRPD